MNQILAVYSILPDPQPDPITGNLSFKNLNELKKQVLPKAPRRIGHMSKYACVGAAACLQKVDGTKIAKDRLGIFHGTALGNINETHTVQQQIFLDPEHLPSPIKFSVSLSNMSSYFAAVVTGAMGPNQVISQNELSFEGALLAAIVSGETDDVDYALVGGTDCFFGSKQETANCLEFPEDSVFGEGTGWLLLGRDRQNSLGEIIDIEQFHQKKGTDDSSVISKRILDTLTKHKRNEEKTWILRGLRIEQNIITDLTNRIPAISIVEYLNKTGLYPTAAAAGIASLISYSPEPGLYLHVARNGMGQAAIVSFRLK